MRILIGKQVISVLFVALVSFFPSDQFAANNMPDGQIVLTRSVTPAEQLQVNPQSKDSWDLPRSELLEFLFGSFLLLIGLATILLSLFRWKANDQSLIFAGAGHMPLLLWRPALDLHLVFVPDRNRKIKKWSSK